MSAPVPSRAVRAFLGFLVARASFGLVYLITTLRGSPVLWYHPLTHFWSFEALPVDFAMDWFGRTALAFGAGAVLGALAWLASARSTWLGQKAVVLGIAHAGGMILLVDFAYFGWTLTRVQASPLPLPSWYCPR